MKVDVLAMAGGDGSRDRARREDPAAERARRGATAELARASGVVRVNGTSMAPTLAEASWVRFAPGRPRPGDVVVFHRAQGDLVVHRFLGHRPGWWNRTGASGEGDRWIVTKPDAAPEFDVEVRASAILGLVAESRPSPEAPWVDLSVSALRRGLSVLWFGRYLLRRALRRLTRRVR